MNSSFGQVMLRWLAKVLGLPPRTGEIIDHPTRVKLALSGLGSLALAGLELTGVLAILPLMQFVAGVAPDQGALGRISALLGHPPNQTLLLLLAGGIVGVFIVKDVAAFLFRRWQLRFMAAQEVGLSTSLLASYLKGPYEWSLEKNTGDKVFTIEAAVTIGYSAGVSSALAILTETVTIFLVVLGMAIVSPLVTLVTVVFFGIGSLAIQRFIRPRIVAAGEAATRTSLETSSASLEALGATKEIKLRHAEDRFVGSYHHSRAIGAMARATSALLSEVPKYILEILFIAAVGIVAIIASVRGSAADLLITLGVFVAAGTRIIPSAVRLISAFSGVKFARAPLLHLTTTMRQLREAIAEEAAEATTTAVPTGDVSLHDVRFAYAQNKEAEILRGIDLVIPSGRSLAIVGGSGAGKTTLVDVLLGLLKPTGGEIRAGGINVRSNLSSWQAQLAVVPQDVYLMDASLARNIAFEDDIDPSFLEDAIRRAQLTDLVASLPDGVETSVGERGARLSGGQRQRLGIARALYRQPRYLFLDEATSALDNETERRLTETIKALSGDITVIIVAHRLSTVRHVDRLIFMEDGLVTAQGTFDQVRQQNAAFAHLVELGQLAPSLPGTP